MSLPVNTEIRPNTYKKHPFMNALVANPINIDRVYSHINKNAMVMT
jgi:hypothetical protein